MPSPRVRSAASFLTSHHHHHHQTPRANRPCPSTFTHTHTHTATPKTFFSTSSPFYATAREPTYYEILDVPVTASLAEIKKQFYALSLRHHPDRNRKDPNASSRFARISSAYQVLGNNSKRATYDRDHGIHHHQHNYNYAGGSTHSTANPGQHPMGSYSSYSANVHSKGGSYAGSRPASGLSKRRGTFQGPPPSFYAHGGYGRRAPPGGGGGGGGGGSSSSAAGGARDDDPTAFVDRNPLNHFNARGHYRTQTAEDARREQRRSRAMGAALNEQYIGTSGDFAIRFFVVCGVLMAAGAMTGLFWTPKDQSRKNKKSSRRGD